MWALFGLTQGKHFAIYEHRRLTQLSFITQVLEIVLRHITSGRDLASLAMVNRRARCAGLPHSNQPTLLHLYTAVSLPPNSLQQQFALNLKTSRVCHTCRCLLARVACLKRFCDSRRRRRRYLCADEDLWKNLCVINFSIHPDMPRPKEGRDAQPALIGRKGLTTIP